MRFSEEYSFLWHKSVAYLSASTKLVAAHKLKGFLENLPALVPRIAAEGREKLMGARGVVANADEIEKGLSDLVEVYAKHWLHSVRVKLAPMAAKLDEFASRYEDAAKALIQLGRVNFAGIRKLGVPYNECEGAALYVSASGQLCLPRVFFSIGNEAIRELLSLPYDLSIKSAAVLASRFCEARWAQIAMKKDPDARAIFYFLHMHQRVPSNRLDSVVAVPIKDFADEIDRYVDAALVRKLIEKAGG